MQKYESLLRERKIKVTPQRLAIVEELDGHIHLSIEELYEAIKKKFPSISLATVYKNINAMMEQGFIEEVRVPGQKSKYELTKSPHSHIVCGHCGKVEDIDLDLEKVTQTAANVSHYDITEKTLILTGVCPKCKPS
jgi:Fur family peroxide stress response transcriptional regulator